MYIPGMWFGLIWVKQGHGESGTCYAAWGDLTF